MQQVPHVVVRKKHRSIAPAVAMMGLDVYFTILRCIERVQYCYLNAVVVVRSASFFHVRKRQKNVSRIPIMSSAKDASHLKIHQHSPPNGIRLITFLYVFNMLSKGAYTIPTKTDMMDRAKLQKALDARFPSHDESDIHDKMRQRRPLRIAVFVPVLNAGETTRGVELAKGIRELICSMFEGGSFKECVDLRFFSGLTGPGSISYEFLIRRAGFEIVHCRSSGNDVDESPFFTKEQWNQLLRNEHSGKEYLDTIQESKFAGLVQGTIRQLKQFQPSIVLHGLEPNASIAAHILRIPNISFVPLPMTKEWTCAYLLTDIPDPQMHIFWRMFVPGILRRALVRWKAFSSDNSGGAGIQRTMINAAIKCGWDGKGICDNIQNVNMFDILRADQTLLLDDPHKYEGHVLPENMSIVGPLFAKGAANDASSGWLLQSPMEKGRATTKQRIQKVLVTMGSSGELRYLAEAVGALLQDDDIYAVVLVPPTICSICELRTTLMDKYGIDILAGDITSRIHLTSEFVSGDVLNSAVDVVIIHGGQGTVQTAMVSGTPIVGLALQAEQQYNLDYACKNRGAGIRISIRDWKAKNIKRALRKVLSMPGYREAANLVRQEMLSLPDTCAVAAMHILGFALTKEKADSSRFPVQIE